MAMSHAAIETITNQNVVFVAREAITCTVPTRQSAGLPDGLKRRPPAIVRTTIAWC